METQPSVQSPFQKLNLAIAVKKHAQIDIKLFLCCPVFLDFSILLGIAAPRRRRLGYSKVYCDVRKRWLLEWNQNRHITHSIFHIPNTNSEIYIRPHFVCFGKFVGISYVNHFGAIMVYELRMLQIPELFHFHAVLLTPLAWHGRRYRTTQKILSSSL